MATLVALESKISKTSEQSQFPSTRPGSLVPVSCPALRSKYPQTKPLSIVEPKSVHAFPNKPTLSLPSIQSEERHRRLTIRRSFCQTNPFFIGGLDVSVLRHRIAKPLFCQTKPIPLNQTKIRLSVLKSKLALAEPASDRDRGMGDAVSLSQINRSSSTTAPQIMKKHFLPNKANLPIQLSRASEAAVKKHLLGKTIRLDSSPSHAPKSLLVDSRPFRCYAIAILRVQRTTMFGFFECFVLLFVYFVVPYPHD